MREHWRCAAKPQATGWAIGRDVDMGPAFTKNNQIRASVQAKFFLDNLRGATYMSNRYSSFCTLRHFSLYTYVHMFM